MAYMLYPKFEDGPQQIDFDIRVSAPMNEVKAGLPVAREAISTPVRITTAHKELPDIVFFEDYFCAVSEAAYRLCERLAPDAVDGHPIAIEERTGEPLPGGLYFLNVLLFRDSVILNESNTIPYKIWVPQPSGKMILESKTRIDFSKLKLSADKIHDAHIWHEAFPGYGGQYYIFVSDLFMDEVRHLGLTGFDTAIRVEEV
jgi:hypothetical protein